MPKSQRVAKSKRGRRILTADNRIDERRWVKMLAGENYQAARWDSEPYPLREMLLSFCCPNPYNLCIPARNVFLLRFVFSLLADVEREGDGVLPV